MNLRELIQKAREAGHDAFGFSYDPELNMISMKISREEFIKEFTFKSFNAWLNVIGEVSKNKRVRNGVLLPIIMESAKVLIAYDFLVMIAFERGAKIFHASYVHGKIDPLILDKAGVIKELFVNDMHEIMAWRTLLAKENKMDESCQSIAGLLEIELKDAIRLFGQSGQEFKLYGV